MLIKFLDKTLQSGVKASQDCPIFSMFRKGPAESFLLEVETQNLLWMLTKSKLLISHIYPALIGGQG